MISVTNPTDLNVRKGSEYGQPQTSAISLMAGAVHARLPIIRINPLYVLADLRCHTDWGSVYLLLHCPSGHSVHNVHATRVHCYKGLGALKGVSWRLVILAPDVPKALTVEWRNILISARPEYRAGDIYTNPNPSAQLLERINFSTESPFVVGAFMVAQFQRNGYWRLHTVLADSKPESRPGCLPFTLVLAQDVPGVPPDLVNPRWMLLTFGKCEQTQASLEHPPPTGEALYYVVARFYDTVWNPCTETYPPSHNCLTDHIETPTHSHSYDYFINGEGNFTYVTAPVQLSIARSSNHREGSLKTMHIHLR